MNTQPEHPTEDPPEPAGAAGLPAEHASTPTPRRRSGRWSILAVAVCAVAAAVLAATLSVSAASAQSPATTSGAAEQQSSGAAADDDSSKDSCDRDGKRRGGKHGWLGSSEVLAEALGISTDELRAELKAGSTIAEIAEANDVDVDDVIAALVAAAQQRAADHDKEIDVDELTEKITAFVNGEKPEHPSYGGKRGFHGGGKRGHFGNSNSSGANADAIA